jgi:hypothetical protein
LMTYAPAWGFVDVPLNARKAKLITCHVVLNPDFPLPRHSQSH